MIDDLRRIASLEPRASSGGLRRVARLAALCWVGALLHTAPALANPAIDAGAADIQAGQYQSAVQRMTSVLSTPDLSSREAATALYYRGLANRKLGKRALAISDLGAAMWLGLPSEHRVIAQVHRGFAFQELGLQPEAEIEFGFASKAAPNQTATLMKEGGASLGDIKIATGGGGGWLDRVPGLGGGTPAPSPAPTTTAAAPAGSPPPQAGSWSTTVSAEGAAPPTRAAPLPPAAPPAASTPPSTATSAAEPAPEPAPQSSGNALTRWFGSWGNSYAEPPAQAEAASGDTATASAGGGSYRLQLAASRSEQEARQLWQKVAQANPQLSGKTPQIEKADVGDLGTFYRLQIGPFSDREESTQLCNNLKRGGVDCFLVTVR